MDPSSALIQSKMNSSMEGMMEALTREKVLTGGPFFDKFMELSDAMQQHNSEAALKASFANINLSDNDDTSTVPMSDGMRASMKAHADWMSFVMSHVEHGVPLEDPTGWSLERLEKYLNEHGVSPRPFPTKKSVLVELARHLVTFCDACMVTINNIPDDDQAAAIGRESAGEATAQDLDMLAKMRTPLAKPDFVVQAQISPGTRLSQCAELRGGECQDRFVQERIKYEKKFGKGGTVCEVWRLLEMIADTYERIWENPGKDYLLSITADKGTDNEKSTAIRPIGLRSIRDSADSSSGDSFPLLEVEYVHATKKEGIKALEKLKPGIRQGTLMLWQELSGIQMDMLLCLLRDNGENLVKDDDAYIEAKHGIPSKWKFSVVRPVNPTKRGGIMQCPGCGEKATKFCSRCKAVAYCSQDCQKAQWKSSHKKACNSARA